MTVNAWFFAASALVFCELVLVAVLLLGAAEADEPQAVFLTRRRLLIEMVGVLAIVVLAFGLLATERTVDIAAHVTREKARGR